MPLVMMGEFFWPNMARGVKIGPSELKVPDMNRLLAAICLLAALAAGAAFAENSPFCGKSSASDWNELRESFVGSWRMDHLAGYVHVAGMTMPFPASSDDDTVSIALFGDELVAVHPDSDDTLLLTIADEPRWDTDAGSDVPEIPVSPDEAAFLYGCDQMEMPRLIGTGNIVIDGMTMDFTYRMMVLSHDQMYGIMQVTGSVQGHPYLARRTVWMERTG